MEYMFSVIEGRFYNSSKNKSVLQRYCFRPVGNDEIFYRLYARLLYREFIGYRYNKGIESHAMFWPDPTWV